MKLVVPILALLAFAPLPSCEDENNPPPGDGYHPADFVAASIHGAETNQGTQDCRGCHGSDLTGGSWGANEAPSCDSCHQPEWRSDCTYCHGPSDTLDAWWDVTTAAAFPVHLEHLNDGDLTQGTDCEACHANVVDVLSAGHVFDSTPNRAEARFDSFNPLGSYVEGTCRQLYCHGDGQADNGVVDELAGQQVCGSCHLGVTEQSYETMSGAHQLHLLGENLVLTCTDCHNDVANASGDIIDTIQHINGAPDVKLLTNAVEDIIWNDVTEQCTGNCHGFEHEEAGSPLDWY